MPRWRRSRCEIARPSACGLRRASASRPTSSSPTPNSAWTYRNLVPAHARRRWTDRRLDRARYSMSLFVWYFGTRRRYEDVAHHTILLGPRYRELLRDIFERKVLADDFSLYLHRPTATDPSLAPPGCDAFYVLSPVPHLDSGTDWETMAEPYRQAIARRLERDAAARPRARDRDLAGDDAARFSRAALLGERRRLRPRAGAAPERLVPAAQSQRGDRAPVPGRRRNASRRRPARRAFLGPSSRQRGAGCKSIRLIATATTLADGVSCREALRTGSRTFLAASFVLPRAVSDPACALYAFCRMADDEIDLGNAGSQSACRAARAARSHLCSAAAAVPRRPRVRRGGLAFRDPSRVAGRPSGGLRLGCGAAAL